MLKDIYFDIICCPNCKGTLKQSSEEQINCQICQAYYPIVDDIPDFIPEIKDKASEIVNEFYASEWKRDETGVLKAKKLHDDLSDRGEQYDNICHDRFRYAVRNPKRQRYFLDAGSGAKPRHVIGESFSYHVCVDFSIDGLKEARKLLGERAICIRGSLLNLPLQSDIMDGALASHCLYHIDKTLQHMAIKELYRTLASDAYLLVFYVNPRGFERYFSKYFNLFFQFIQQRSSKNHNEKEENSRFLYYYPHSISVMLQTMKEIFPENKVWIKPLRLFSIDLSQPFFTIPIVGFICFKSWTLFEKLAPSFISLPFCTYVSYLAQK